MFMMFGDVGGVYDFLLILLAPFFSFLSQKFMMSSLIQKLFHAALDSEAPHCSPKESLAAIRPLSFSRSFTLFAFCRRQGMRHQALKLGASRVDKALDIVQMVR